MTDQDLDSVDERLAQTFERIAALRERLQNWDPDAEIPVEPTPEPGPDPEPEPETIAPLGIEPSQYDEPAATSVIAGDGTADHREEMLAESLDQPEPDAPVAIGAALEIEAGPVDGDAEPSTPQAEAEAAEPAQLETDATAEPAEAAEPAELVAQTERDRAEARRTQALRDLEELDARVAAGDIDPDDAQQVRRDYLADAEQAQEDLEAIAAAARRRSFLRPRVLAGAVLLLGGIAAAVFAVTQFIGDREPGPPVTGDIVTDAGPAVDFGQMSIEEMEAALLATPAATEMRLELARRYVQTSDFQRALPHYLQVLQSEENVEAYAYLGWMEYLSGESAAGAELVEKAVAIDADDPLALAMLAVIRLEGLGDATGAIEVLDRMAANPHLPEDLRQSVADMRARAEAAS